MKRAGQIKDKMEESVCSWNVAEAATTWNVWIIGFSVIGATLPKCSVHSTPRGV